MALLTVSLITLWCVVTSRTSNGLEVIPKGCQLQQPTVLPVDQSGEHMTSCSNNGTIATLTCRVDFHCADHVIVGLIWAGFYSHMDNYRTDAREETGTGASTETNDFHWNPLETEQRYSSKTHKLPGKGHVLEAVLEVTSVREEDYDRKFKCVVVTEYSYENMGKPRPDIQGRICASAHITQGRKQTTENNSAGSVTYTGSVLLAVLSSTVLQMF